MDESAVSVTQFVLSREGFCSHHTRPSPPPALASCSFFSFLLKWSSKKGADAIAAARTEADGLLAAARRLADATNAHLWSGDHYVGYDVKRRVPLTSRTYQCAWPCWAGIAPSAEARDAALASVLAPDLRARFGIRSTSTADARYTLTDCIVPYRYVF